MIRVLILGGTTEAAGLADRLVRDARFDVVTSLAGRTRRFRAPPGAYRVGGFGGASGLAAYLQREAVDLVLDATHPFAATMAANAASACTEAGRARLKIVRPPWRERDGDRWIHVADIAAAAAWLSGREGTVFLTVGRQELAAFETVSGPRFLARMIDPLERPSPIEIILGRGPFAVADEERLLRELGVTLLVSKNSGGGETAAKLDAARRLSLPVLMIGRPSVPPGERVDSVDAALDWIEAYAARLRESGGRML